MSLHRKAGAVEVDEEMRLMGWRALAVDPEPVGIALSRRFAMLTLSKRVPLTLIPIAVSRRGSPLQ